MWEQIDGSDLLLLYEGGQVESVVPKACGIYAWRLNPVSVLNSAHNYEAILKQVQRLTQLPQGETGPQRLNHSILLKGLEVSGPELEGEKLVRIREFLKDPSKAAWTNGYLKALGGYLPNMYVGKADVISARVKNHLAGATDFGKKIESTSNSLSWDDLTFHWLEIPTNDRAVLEAFEFITASLSMSAFSKRIG